MCFQRQKNSIGESLQYLLSTGLSILQYCAVNVILLLSLIFSACLPTIYSFYPCFTWDIFCCCSLGLLCRKTLIECLLMLWPSCLHPAFSAALTPLTHYKACRTSVRLPRKASHHHLCKTPGTSESVKLLYPAIKRRE